MNAKQHHQSVILLATPAFIADKKLHQRAKVGTWGQQWAFRDIL